MDFTPGVPVRSLVHVFEFEYILHVLEEEEAALALLHMGGAAGQVVPAPVAQQAVAGAGPPVANPNEAADAMDDDQDDA